jgi:hypothetical protein
MIKVFESLGEPANFFDDQIDGLGAAVADAAGIEVGQIWASMSGACRPAVRLRA